MDSLTPEQVKEIAGEIDCGNRCYLHKQTGEFLFIPDIESNPYADYEFFAQELEKLENEFDNYMEIKRPGSNESFNIMLGFTNQFADNNGLKSRLIETLSKHKPFREFKFQIDNSGIYRDQWFTYKDAWLQQWVMDAFEAANRMSH